MPIKVVNWPLSILAIAVIGVFVSLGCWQLSRAEHKQALLALFAKRTEHQPLSNIDMLHIKDGRFYRAQLHGQFDNAHTLLLDNKTYKGQVGYEIYTPFYASGLNTPILVDRGFIPIINSRQILPHITPIYGETTITGLINTAPLYVSFSSFLESTNVTWPLRVQYINLSELSQILPSALYPYVLNITPHTKPAYAIHWQVNIMSPEKHRGYALQWFAFALILLILLIALNRRPSELKTKND